MAILKIYQSSRGHGRCRSCDAPVEWAELVTSGKRMPFDPPIIVVQTEGSPIADRVIEHVDSEITKSHFATCPDGPTWRKRKQ